MSGKETEAKPSSDGSGPFQPASDATNPPAKLQKECQQQSGKSGGKPVLQKKWLQMFARLLEFREKHKHVLVPNRYNEDRSLGAWVSTQRRQYKAFQAGEETPMNKERASKLGSVGFVWSTRDPRHVPWELRYQQLVGYHQVHGDALVPIHYKPNPQLSNWVSTQRQEMKLLRDSRPTRLTAERIQLLNNLKFVWEAQRGGPKKKHKYNNVGAPPPVEAGRLQAAAPVVPPQVANDNVSSPSPPSSTQPGQVDSVHGFAQGKKAASEGKSDTFVIPSSKEGKMTAEAIVTAGKNLDGGKTSGVAEKKSKESSSTTSEVVATGETRQLLNDGGTDAKKPKNDKHDDSKEEAAVALLSVGKD